MKCHEFEHRLNELLDARLVPERDLQLCAHARVCEACSQSLAGHAALLAGLRQPGPTLMPDFSDRVVAASLAPGADAELPPAAPQRSWWLVAAALATAASLLVVVGVGRTIRQNRLRNDLTTQGPGTSNPNRPDAKPKSRGIATMVPGRSAPRRYAAYGLQLNSFAATLPEAAQHLDEVERYAPGFRPLRMSFSMLLDALCRTIPGLNTPARDEKAAQWPVDLGRVA